MRTSVSCSLRAMLLVALPVAAIAEVYDLPPEGSDVVGAITTITARADDTLLEIARRHGLGYEDIVRANPEVDAWLPGEGTTVTLPTRYVLPQGIRDGVVLNLAEYRMYYFPAPKEGGVATVMTYPISIGRMDWETPLGRTTVVAKAKDPAWYPPESIRAEHAAEGDPLPRVVPAGPQNPLGKYAMRLGLPGYLIHGTNRPAGVGMRVTHGCIRMFPEDIDFLYGKVGLNTTVRIINEPVKMGWNGDELVVEVHRTLETSPVLVEEALAESEPDANMQLLDPAEIEGLASESIQTEPGADPTVVAETAPPVRGALTMLTEQFVRATNERPAELDWETAEQILARADGIPATVGQVVVPQAIKNAATSAASE